MKLAIVLWVIASIVVASVYSDTEGEASCDLIPLHSCAVIVAFAEDVKEENKRRICFYECKKRISDIVSDPEPVEDMEESSITL
jgi:hypothetical protein